MITRFKYEAREVGIITFAHQVTRGTIKSPVQFLSRTRGRQRKSGREEERGRRGKFVISRAVDALGRFKDYFHVRPSVFR